jgi:hypothetical protein
VKECRNPQGFCAAWLPDFGSGSKSLSPNRKSQGAQYLIHRTHHADDVRETALGAWKT